MHYYRYVDKGSLDPRCKNYFIYSCNICGNEEQFFTDNEKTFELRNRKCYKCGVTDDTNEMDYYLNKRSELEDEIKSKQEELYAIISKIQILALTKENDHAIPSTV